MEYLTEFEKIRSLAVAVLVALAVLTAIAIVPFTKSSATAVRLTGAALVTALAFGANNGFVYALGVFVAATLVAEIEFLEKLAALAWNRSEYWVYLTKATKEEVDKKLAEEEADQSSLAASAGLPDRRSFPLRFHRSVLSALKTRSGPFAHVGPMREEVKIVDPRTVHIVDAVVAKGDHLFVIEIKAGTTKPALRSGLKQLRTYMKPLANMKQDLSVVTLVLIVPAGKDVPDQFEEAVVLQYDLETESFTNLSRVGWLLEL